MQIRTNSFADLKIIIFLIMVHPLSYINSNIIIRFKTKNSSKVDIYLLVALAMVLGLLSLYSLRKKQKITTFMIALPDSLLDKNENILAFKQ